MHPGRFLRWIGPAFVLASAAFGRNSDDPAAAAAGCAVCSTFLLIPIAFLVLGIILRVWVAKDAKARGMDDAILWMVLVMLTNVLGLVIDLLARPQGNLMPCPNCQNMRLQASVKCPHCGA